MEQTGCTADLTVAITDDVGVDPCSDGLCPAAEYAAGPTTDSGVGPATDSGVGAMTEVLLSISLAS